MMVDRTRSAKRLGASAFVAYAVAISLLFCPLPSAAAQTGDVSGTVTGVDGVPIAGAAVSLSAKNVRQSRRTDARGAFTMSGVTQGTYVLDVDAPGYEHLGGRTIDVAAGRTNSVAVELARSGASLTTLGRVVTRGGEALSTSSAATQDLDAQAFVAAGGSSLAEMLSQQAASVAVIRPAGGNPAAPAVAALRGPDPTETLFDVDGHSLNSGGSGAFDVSLLDPAQLSAVQLVYGIAPSSLVGPNTIDGAINVRTIEPTAESHGLYRFSAGSFSSYGETLQATGSDGELGYALSLHRQISRGEAVQEILTVDGTRPTVGSALAGDTALMKVRIGPGGDGNSVGVTLRDQSISRDLSAALSSVVSAPGAPATYSDFSGSAELAHNAGFGVDARFPLGRASSSGISPSTLLVRHLTEVDDQSVSGPAAGINPYLLNERDLIDDDIVQIDRIMSSGTLSAKIELRTESLGTQLTPGGTNEQVRFRRPLELRMPADGQAPSTSAADLAQTQRSAALRYTLDSTAKLHYALAAYYSSFSSFGSSLDPRIGVTWTPSAQTSIRASVGATFQSPQLPELYVPAVLPPPDSNGFINVGNPSLTADHATDYGLGIEHIFAGDLPARLAVDLYRTNLRNPAQRFIPSANCLTNPPPPPQACESFPINIGGATYQGIEGRVGWYVGRSTHVSATYVVNSSYPTAVSPDFQNGTIVVGEQFSGVPLQSGTLSIEGGGTIVSYEAGMRFEGRYNEMNRPPFVTLHAGVTWRRPHIEVGLYGTNLTNAYDDRFTLAGQGVPYGGVAGPIPTDAYSLQGRAVTLVLTSRY